MENTIKISQLPSGGPVQSEAYFPASAGATTVKHTAQQIGVFALNVAIEGGNDIEGTVNTARVVRLRNRPISTNTPTSGQALVWNGTEWAPATISTVVELDGDVTGTSGNVTVVGLQGRDISPTAPSTGQILRYNGTIWEAANETNSTASNGLAVTGVDVQLGGSLTKDTLVDGAFALNLNNSRVIVGSASTSFSPQMTVNRATSSGSTLTSVNLFLNTADNTAAKLGLGLSGNYNAGLSFVPGVSRFFSLTSGDNIRFAVGGETFDKVVIAGNGIGRLGAGFSSMTGLHSTLQSAGSIAARVLATISSAYTLTEADCIVVIDNATATSFTITLPDATTCGGRMYILLNDCGLNISLSVSVRYNGSGTSIVSAFKTNMVFSDGTIWRGINLN